jgi:hypothetical protein
LSKPTFLQASIPLKVWETLYVSRDSNSAWEIARVLFQAVCWYLDWRNVDLRCCNKNKQGNRWTVNYGVRRQHTNQTFVTVTNAWDFSCADHEFVSPWRHHLLLLTKTEAEDGTQIVEATNAVAWVPMARAAVVLALWRPAFWMNMRVADVVANILRISSSLVIL